jgi:hypothetical protein
MFKKVMISVFICLFVVTSLYAAPADYSASSLQSQQGRYFKWTAPPGWRVRESNAGVTLTSPDGIYSASLATILRSRGARTPQAFLQWVFSHTPSYRNARILSLRNLPSERQPFRVWQFIEATVSYTDNGLPVTSLYKVGVANYSGLNDAIIVGYRAANANFQQAQSFMPQIAKSIVLTNAAEANGNNTLLQPKNRPLDNSQQIKSWEKKERIEAETQHQRQNTITDRVDLYDPNTGETLNASSQNTNYYWRKPGTNEVVGNNSGYPPAPGYTQLQAPPPPH